VNKSAEINELAKALAAAQGEMKNPPLDGENPHFKSRFATLAGVRDTVLPVLSRHGLSVIQSAGSGERGPTLTTLLLHTSGQWVETDALCLPAVKQDPQSFGSALTYGRRYSLMALAGVVGDDDDDGQAASKPAPAKAGKQQQDNGTTAKKASAPAAPAPAKPALPTDGAELQRRICDYDAKLAGQGLCQPGELVKAVVAAGKPKGYPDDLASWPAEGFPLAAEATKAFEAERRARKGQEANA
jgi:hypothetical protein